MARAWRSQLHRLGPHDRLIKITVPRDGTHDVAAWLRRVEAARSADGIGLTVTMTEREFEDLPGTAPSTPPRRPGEQRRAKIVAAMAATTVDDPAKTIDAHPTIAGR